MTPSEIADWLDGHVWYERYGLAAATIRELEARALQAEEGAEVWEQGFVGSKAKLKIATEALEKMVSLYENDHDPECLARPKWLVEALARIKEVGDDTR